MKVKVLKPFIDLTDGVERKDGDVFECSEARFNEIKAKLPKWVEAVSEKSQKSVPRKTAKKSTKKTGK